ncbi:MAG: DNA methyltransferase [Anaerolineae bacterium]|nr:DNA methyltransferase [Anaerolineae bacterium]
MAAMQADLRPRLRAIIDGDLCFHDADSGYATHNFHAFPAKFPPQLPRAFIDALTRPGDRVLDPMAGSGTTLVEAYLAGCPAVGVDIDPLALLLCRVKTQPRDLESLRATGERIVQAARRALRTPAALAEAIRARYDEQSRAFF